MLADGFVKKKRPVGLRLTPPGAFLRAAEELWTGQVTLSDLQERDIDFISLTEKMDTTTAGRKLIFPLMDALAEFEHDLIRERITASLAAARA